MKGPYLLWSLIEYTSVKYIFSNTTINTHTSFFNISCNAAIYLSLAQAHTRSVEVAVECYEGSLSNRTSDKTVYV